ncbi:MAG: hypothetical protein ACYTBP_02800 [Planctomycetota bacterium]|jgi:hypothetical protein
MGELNIEIKGGQSNFSPGQKVEGAIRWNVQDNPERIELSLFWRTEGKGTQDVGVVETMKHDNPGSFGSRDFSFTLPSGPYSFSGKLISLIWALELSTWPEGETIRSDITVSPGGNEILLQKSLDYK